VKTAVVVRPAMVDPDAWLADVESFAALGITEVMTMPDRHPVEFINGVAEKILPRLSQIG
jgi:hypothetical protein